MHEERVREPSKCHVERNHEKEAHVIQAVLVAEIVSVDHNYQHLKRKDQEGIHYVDGSLALCDEVLLAIVLNLGAKHHRVVVVLYIELLSLADLPCFIVDQTDTLCVLLMLVLHREFLLLIRDPLQLLQVSQPDHYIEEAVTSYPFVCQCIFVNFSFDPKPHQLNEHHESRDVSNE